MSNSAFIINPLSHTVAKHGSQLVSAGVTTDANSYILDSFDKLAPAVSAILSAGQDHVFIEGGDGTIHGVLSMFMAQQPDVSKLPYFTLLPGGMTNLVAAHVGLKRPSAKKIMAMVNNPNAPQTTELPMLGVKADDADITHYGFLLSTGAMPVATRYCADHVHTKGVGGSAAVRSTLLKVLFGRGKERDIILKPSPLNLDLGIEAIDGDHILAAATTLPSMMIGLNPFWGNGDGKLKITHIQKDAQHVIRNMARFIKSTQSKRSAKTLKRDGFESWNVDKAVIQLSGEVVLDGEFLPQTNAPISLFATAPLRFIK